MHVSIVVVHYNTPTETNECLRSLLALEKKIDHNIVIVDNGSLTSYEIPSKLDKKNVTLIRSESNLGFTGGNNLGTYKAIELYNSDFVLYLNNDTTVAPNLLSSLVESAQDPDVGIVAPHIYFYPGTQYHTHSYPKKDQDNIFWFAGGFIDWNNLYAGHIGVDELDHGQFSHKRETEFISGCCMLVKREVLEKSAVFDKRYFLYYEDTDLSMRARAAGYTLLITPETHIWHKNAGSSGGSGSSLQEYYQTRNRALFFFTHGGLRVKLRVIKLMLRSIASGNQVQKRAAWDLLALRFGKQPLV